MNLNLKLALPGSQGALLFATLPLSACRDRLITLGICLIRPFCPRTSNCALHHISRFLAHATFSFLD
jgi:hypothetical protein